MKGARGREADFPLTAEAVTRAGLNSSSLPKVPSDPRVYGETLLPPFSQVSSPT